MNFLNRKTVIVSIDSSSGSYINNTISRAISDVAFIPDEVVVRTISVSNGHNTNEVFIITSSLISNNVLGCCSVHDGETSNTNPQSVFPLGTPINGNYSFTLLNTVNLNLVINIVLEFIQYAK
jgi:hypothetical protein